MLLRVNRIATCFTSDHENSTVNRAPWFLSPRPIRNSPPIRSTRERTILIPSPLPAAGSNPSGKSGPSLQTDSAQPFPGLDSKLTVIRPVPYLAAFVISSLAMNPSETFALKQYLEEGLLLTHIRAMFGSPVTLVPSEVINLGVKVHPHDHIGKAGRF